jgi:hypothetical protein
MNNCPCNGCKDRFYDDKRKVTCHSFCDKYKHYKQVCEKVNQSKRNEAIYWGYASERSSRLKRQGKIIYNNNKGDNG